MKKRYILLIVFVGLIVFGSIIAFTRPVLPVIQLPGECYPGIHIPVFNCLTNTFVTTIVAWLIVFAIALALRARSRTADEVPTGFYNFFEMIIDGGMNFATNLSGASRAKVFFPLFMTLILYILVANWIELVPGVDSIGFYEWLPHLEAERDAADEESKAESKGEVAFADPLEREEYVHEREELHDSLNEGAFRVDPFVIKSPDNAVVGDVDESDPRAGRDPETADWAVVAFFRAPATDLNFTLALALVTMVYVQVIGFKYLGIGYLKKFFPVDSNVDAMAKNPMKVMDWAVGILELIGEISRVISFSFRLLGNIFAGQVLLFVIAFILPAISVAFFGLEFFVGLIQAMIFGLLALLFMAGAAEHHGDDDDH